MTRDHSTADWVQQRVSKSGARQDVTELCMNRTQRRGRKEWMKWTWMNTRRLHKVQWAICERKCFDMSRFAYFREANWHDVSSSASVASPKRYDITHHRRPLVSVHCLHRPTKFYENVWLIVSQQHFFASSGPETYIQLKKMKFCWCPIMCGVVGVYATYDLWVV